MNSLRPQPSAFSLIEVTIALGIAAFAFVAILGLLPVGLQTTRTAHEQSAALDIGTLIVSDLQATAIPPGATDPEPSPRYRVQVPPAGGPVETTIFINSAGSWSTPAGPPPTAAEDDSRYRVKASLTAMSDRSITGFVRLSWPAFAEPANAEGRLELPVAIGH